MFLFILEMRVDVTYEKIHSVKGGKTNYSLTPHPLVLNVPSPTEVMLYHCPWLKKKKQKPPERQKKPNPMKTLRLCCQECRAPASQSDFSFSFMCRKTTLKMKSPSIMEKALA